MSNATFKKKMLLAQGIVNKFTRNIQSEFQVPDITAHAVQEPMAQWMWARQPNADETDVSFYHPASYQDLSTMMPTILGGVTWYNTTGISEIFDSHFMLAWRAKYQVTNMSNVPVRYVLKVFKVKKNVENISATAGSSQSLANPLNMVGQYLRATGDKAAIDSPDAANGGLHTERTRLETIPTWTHWYKTIKTVPFKLEPGVTKTYSLRRKYVTYKTVDLYPTLVDGTGTQPAIRSLRRKGDVFVMVKMLSEVAGVNDGVVGLAATTTRTRPVSILSYSCNYFTRRVPVAIKTQFTGLPSYGFAPTVLDANRVVMADEDIKEVAQSVVT